jgi:hypothetical protein
MGIVAVAVAAALLASGPGASAATPAGPATGTVPVRVAADPLQVALRLSTRTATVGMRLSADETVVNLASGPLSAVGYRILVASAGLRVSGPFGGRPTIPALGRASASFQLCAVAPGAYLVQALATGTTVAGLTFTEASSALLLQVGPGSGRPRC